MMILYYVWWKRKSLFLIYMNKPDLTSIVAGRVLFHSSSSCAQVSLNLLENTLSRWIQPEFVGYTLTDADNRYLMIWRFSHPPL